MTQLNNEFEHWFKNNYPNIETTSAYAKLPNKAWQAATAESDKRIAELEAHINVLREALEEITAKEHTEENEWDAVEVVIPAIVDIAKQVLASTPAQPKKDNKMQFEIKEMKELENGGAELIIDMDEKTKHYLLNFAIIEIIKRGLIEVKELHNEV